jgi:hypothetical protein
VGDRAVNGGSRLPTAVSRTVRNVVHNALLMNEKLVENKYFFPVASMVRTQKISEFVPEGLPALAGGLGGLYMVPPGESAEFYSADL